MELMGLIELGWTTRRIARHFGCSDSTIERRIRRLKDHFGTDSRSRLAAIAARLNLEELPS